jgi:hypothetical protein
MRKLLIVVSFLFLSLPGLAQVVFNASISNLKTTESAIKLDFNTLADSAGITGLKIDAPIMTLKGVRYGIEANVSTNSRAGQQGDATGRLALVGAWYAHGSVIGAYGSSNPINLSNFNGDETSNGVGGRFVGGPTQSVLDLDGVGSYWVGGVYGTLRGTINGKAGSGAVAAVIGVDIAEGEAEHYAGYFRGNVCIDGSIWQRGSVLHADYVFEENFPLESIEEHADFMWREKHLRGVPPKTVDEHGNDVVEIGRHNRGMLEELEKAHIYIARLNEIIQRQEDRLSKMEARLSY